MQQFVRDIYASTNREALCNLRSVRLSVRLRQSVNVFREWCERRLRLHTAHAATTLYHWLVD